MKHFREHLLPIFAFIALAAMFAGLVLLAYWQLHTYDVMKFNKEYQTEKIVYHQGESTYYTVDYCKKLNVPATIRKEFVDGIIFTAISPQAMLTIGCREQTVPLEIPNSLPPGRYRLRNTITYQVNPIRTVEYVHYSNWFTVVRNESGAYGLTPSELSLNKE